MINTHFDIAVIGAGPGGYATALRAASLGKSVVLIDSRQTPGGVCVHEGCIPSRALIHATQLKRRFLAASLCGLHANHLEINPQELLSYQQETVASMVTNLASLLSARGVTYIQAEAALVDSHTVRLLPVDTVKQPIHEGVEAAGDSALDTEISITADDVVLAMGSRTNVIPALPISHQGVLSSTDALNLSYTPESAIIVGTGDVGLEFASIWSDLGVHVTLIERGPRILKSSTRRISATLLQTLRKNGVTVLTNISIDDVTEQTDSVQLSYTDSHNNQQMLTAQVLLSATGRRPNTDFEWIQALGIQCTETHRISTDPYGRTSVDHIWAVGDITEGKQVAHRAYAQGIVIAESIAGLSTTPVNNMTVPLVTFGLAENSSVGLTAEEARLDTSLCEVIETSYPLTGNACVAMEHDTTGIITIVSARSHDTDSDPYIVGVQMAGPGVTDFTAEAQELIGNHISVHEASQLIHPHPTISEAFGEALLLADGRPLHAR